MLLLDPTTSPVSSCLSSLSTISSCLSPSCMPSLRQYDPLSHWPRSSAFGTFILLPIIWLGFSCRIWPARLSLPIGLLPLFATCSSCCSAHKVQGHRGYLNSEFGSHRYSNSSSQEQAHCFVSMTTSARIFKLNILAPPEAFIRDFPSKGVTLATLFSYCCQCCVNQRIYFDGLLIQRLFQFIHFISSVITIMRRLLYQPCVFIDQALPIVFSLFIISCQNADKSHRGKVHAIVGSSKVFLSEQLSHSINSKKRWNYLSFFYANLSQSNHE